MVNNESCTTNSAPDPVHRIVLTGFMGSGKTTVGPLVARKLGWRFIDVDDVIEAEAAMTIAAIFEQHGEAAFRRREQETIARLLAQVELVLALGGGAIETDATRRLLLSSPGTRLIHLEVSLATTLDRCRGSEGTRPVLADQANLAARYERRLPLYRMAHASIAADVLPPRKLAETIIRTAGLGRASNALS
jgi:shikimate kinase